MRVYHFPVVLEEDEDGMIVATVPTLRGCVTQGANVEEAMANIREAIELTLEAEVEREHADHAKLVGLREVEVCLP